MAVHRLGRAHSVYHTDWNYRLSNHTNPPSNPLRAVSPRHRYSNDTGRIFAFADKYQVFFRLPIPNCWCLMNQIGHSQRPFGLLPSCHWVVQVQRTCHCILSMPELLSAPGTLYFTLAEVAVFGQLYRSYLCSCLQFKQRRKSRCFFVYLRFLIVLIKLDNNTYSESNGHPIPDLISRLRLCHRCAGDWSFGTKCTRYLGIRMGQRLCRSNARD